MITIIIVNGHPSNITRAERNWLISPYLVEGWWFSLIDHNGSEWTNGRMKKKRDDIVKWRLFIPFPSISMEIIHLIKHISLFHRTKTSNHREKEIERERERESVGLGNTSKSKTSQLNWDTYLCGDSDYLSGSIGTPLFISFYHFFSFIHWTPCRYLSPFAPFSIHSFPFFSFILHLH